MPRQVCDADMLAGVVVVGVVAAALTGDNGAALAGDGETAAITGEAGPGLDAVAGDKEAARAGDTAAGNGASGKSGALIGDPGNIIWGGASALPSAPCAETMVPREERAPTLGATFAGEAEFCENPFARVGMMPRAF